MTPFLGEIVMFGGDFPPKGWALCQGQSLSIAQNTALFSLLGTTYGGNGTTTFALPDLRGRAPIHLGQGPGLSNRVIGQLGGAEAVTLTLSQLPAHVHTSIGTAPASGQPATETDPAGHVFAVPADGSSAYATSSNAQLGGVETSGSSGGSQPHENLQPYLCVNFIIATEGVFPSQN